MLISPDIYFKTVFEWLCLLHLLLKNCDFLNTDISQGSVATRLGCGWGVFTYDFVTNFLLSLTSERILKIGQYLVKLWSRVRCLIFFTHGVVTREQVRFK